MGRILEGNPKFHHFEFRRCCRFVLAETTGVMTLGNSLQKLYPMVSCQKKEPKNPQDVVGVLSHLGNSSLVIFGAWFGGLCSLKAKNMFEAKIRDFQNQVG